MYQLIIADDERTTRDSLRELIPWSELGISQVGTARNGFEALEISKNLRPDILLTDIRMPKLDGLELAKQIRVQYPECKILFLTGYADKNYLKTAIHLKAAGYLEKPLNLEELKAVIRETVALCDQELQKKQALIRLKNKLNDSAPLIRQAVTLELVSGNTNLTELTDKYGHICLPFLEHSCYTVVCIVFNWNATAKPLKNNHLNHYRQALLTALSTDYIASPDQFCAGFDSFGNLVLIWRGQIAATLTDSTATLKSMLSKITLLTKNNCRCAAGVSGVANGPDQIPNSYRKALLAATLQFYSDTQPVFYQSDLSSSSAINVDKELFINFKECLQTDNFNMAQALLENITAQAQLCRDCNLNRVKNVYFHLLLAVYEVALERGLIDPFKEREETYIWKEILTKRSLEELSGYVKSSIGTIYNQLVESGAISRKVQEIIRYIRHNYADKTLSIQSISAHVYLSPTYLCAFFKKSTGKTLNEFITEIRLAKAKELLRDVRLKLYQIAAKVGFTDVNYFSTLFKRRVGCTPSEFREKYYR